MSTIHHFNSLRLSLNTPIPGVNYHNMKLYLGNTKPKDDIKFINNIDLRYYSITLIQ